MRAQPSLDLGQHQHLTLTPQLRQALALLQCSSQELDQEIARALADNPLLETVEPEPESAAQAERLDRLWSQPARAVLPDDLPEPGQPPSLIEHLLQQLHATRATERDCLLVVRLMGELDERGYLEFDPSALADGLPPDLGVEDDEWRMALRLLQSFDPPGVGARDLPECLRLQLRARADEWPEDVLACARLLTERLEDLGAGRWGRLCEALGCDRALLDAAHRALRRLNPRPAGAWQTDPIHYVVPDVLFHRAADGWRVSLNPAVEPRVRLSPELADGLTGQDLSPELRDRVRQARSLIHNLDQRRQTILRVAEYIARHQRAFLESGVAALRPLTLREVAQALELHESTISRATRLKYAQTPWGVHELKFFFGTVVQTRSGEETSALAVQALMRAMLESEPAGKPLSDMRLAQLLADRNVVIARRTVAKYREAMGVPPASMRKARGPAGA
ncbi:RNA polymerase factor sigma-54 [Castellaniella denitrificans]|uniref:RNA polymerase sigma-54 factor n=1 Tax=Castellaniella denitrificans TaxID=56119 RepID=A0ABT4M0E1_9BURK|nr:RNA polymerase factor sigma-54 [Castellaniella denitrificans]MCZ4328787.1 RNA polymerase factor sigma-54 [Castellaniella denitrificans]